jgi:membrane fusion protein (multidrug efflux system)
MADPSEINPRLHSADAELSGHHGPAEKIYRLTRNAPAARDAPGAGEAAKPESKARPEDRKP